MDEKWVCSDCGTEIPYSRLDEINKERKEKGIGIMARFVHCKGTDHHIPGIVGRFYYLTEKGKKAYDAVQRMFDELAEIENQSSEQKEETHEKTRLRIHEEYIQALNDHFESSEGKEALKIAKKYASIT